MLDSNCLLISHMSPHRMLPSLLPTYYIPSFTTMRIHQAALPVLNLAKASVTGIGIPAVELIINGVLELATLVDVSESVAHRECRSRQPADDAFEQGRSFPARPTAGQFHCNRHFRLRGKFEGPADHAGSVRRFSLRHLHAFFIIHNSGSSLLSLWSANRWPGSIDSRGYS
jgi:hypothetical protein